MLEVVRVSGGLLVDGLNGSCETVLGGCGLSEWDQPCVQDFDDGGGTLSRGSRSRGQRPVCAGGSGEVLEIFDEGGNAREWPGEVFSRCGEGAFGVEVGEGVDLWVPLCSSVECRLNDLCGRYVTR